MNKKKASITIKTIYPYDEVSDFFTEADCTIEPDGTLCMEYEESLVDLNDTRTVMRIKDDSVSIERTRQRGEGCSFMFFQQNKTHHGKYVTELGEMDICIYTSRLKTKRAQNEVEADIDYSLMFNKLDAGVMKLKINARYSV